MSFKSKGITLNSIIKNKYILYLIALIAFIDILGYIMRQELSAVLFFYLVGMITYYYTKNMTLVLGTSLIVTSLVHLVKNMLGIKEGMKANSVKKPDKESKTDKVLENNKGKPVRPVRPRKKLLDKLEKAGLQSLQSGYTNQQKLTPGLYNIPNKAQLEKQLGKADKIESAYDNLEKVIGENGIQSMSETTKELVRQQNELLKGLKDVTPALNEAMGAIGKIDLGGLTSIFNSTKTNIQE